MTIIKKVTMILIIAIICIMYTNIISIAATATIITETLRLRKEPSTDSKIVDLISEDEKVEILEANVGDDKNWYKVKYKENTGYVYGRYIEIDNNNTANNNSNTTKPNTNTTSNNNTTTQNNNTNTANTTTQNNNNNNVGAPFEGIPVSNDTTVPDNNNTIENNTQPESPNEENNKPEENNENTIVVSAETFEINTYKIVNEQTELYIIPLINASKIYTIEPNKEVYIIQILNGWAYVKSENNYGWLRCNKLN